MKKLTLLLLMASLNAAGLSAALTETPVDALAEAFITVALDNTAVVVAEEASDDVPGGISSLTPEQAARRRSHPSRSQAETMRLRKARQRRQQCVLQ